MALLTVREYLDQIRNTGDSKGPEFEEETVTKEIFIIVQSVQEILMSMDEEDKYLRDIMVSTADVGELSRHFAMLRHYYSKLGPLLNAFELETFKEQQSKEKSHEAASGVE